MQLIMDTMIKKTVRDIKHCYLKYHNIVWFVILTLMVIQIIYEHFILGRACSQLKLSSVGKARCERSLYLPAVYVLLIITYSIEKYSKANKEKKNENDKKEDENDRK